MSLLRWKEMAEKQSELGKKINAIKETIKQKNISDSIGEVQAEKLFKPITSGLKDLTGPKIPIRRLPTKKNPVPDYGLEIGDDEEVPDYGLEDLFGEEVKPQNDKQLVPKPPTYEDVLKELESGEKQMFIDPEYMLQPEDLPPGYEEDETPDYEILEEDRINQILDQLGISDYDDIQLQLNQEFPSQKAKQTFLSNKIKAADKKRQELPGYSTAITNKLKKGLISEAEAQYRRKIIQDTRKVLTDYINYNNTKLKDIKGSGIRRKQRGGNVMFFNDPTEMVNKLELIIGSMAAGNNSKELRNTGVAILDILFRNAILNEPQYNRIYENYFNLN